MENSKMFRQSRQDAQLVVVIFDILFGNFFFLWSGSTEKNLGGYFFWQLGRGFGSGFPQKYIHRGVGAGYNCTPYTVQNPFRVPTIFIYLSHT